MLVTLVLGIAAWFLFMWGVKSGQFDDIEGPKYRMFDDEDIPIGSEMDTSNKSKKSKSTNSLGDKGDGQKNHH